MIIYIYIKWRRGAQINARTTERMPARIPVGIADRRVAILSRRLRGTLLNFQHRKCFEYFATAFDFDFAAIFGQPFAISALPLFRFAYFCAACRWKR